jgi:SAM-dependent methyltransferase
MQSNLWSQGDFSKIAINSLVMSETLCDALPIYAGQTVLDIGCGSGNTAMAAARRRAIVTGVDPVPALLEAARQRAAFDGLPIQYLEGPAEALPLESHSFDAACSTFGLIFSEDAPRAIAETSRVLKPAADFVFTSWAEGGFNDLLFAQCLSKTELPAISAARRWGREDYAIGTLLPHFESVRVQRRHFLARALTPQHWLDGLKANLAPAIAAYDTLNPNEATEFDKELLALAAQFNTAPNGSFFVPSAYLEFYCRNKRSA